MVKQVIFDETTTTQDWVWQYRLLQEGHAEWNEDEIITLGMSPDFAAWDDYGHRSRSFPQSSPAYEPAPFFQASSNDSSQVVVLTDPNLIDIRVPWNTMRQMGPGSVHVTIAWQRVIPVVVPLNSPLQSLPPDKLRIWAKRLGVPVADLLIAEGAVASPVAKTTLVTGTLPVLDGVV